MASEDTATGRATVALVAAKLDGLRDLTHAGFVDVQRQLDALADVPRTLVDVRARHEALERRVDELEDAADKGREWRRGPLLLLAGGSAVALINLIPALVR